MLSMRTLWKGLAVGALALLVGADGPDLVLHLRTRSRDLRLG